MIYLNKESIYGNNIETQNDDDCQDKKSSKSKCPLCPADVSNESVVELKKKKKAQVHKENQENRAKTSFTLPASMLNGGILIAGCIFPEKKKKNKKVERDQNNDMIERPIYNKREIEPDAMLGPKRTFPCSGCPINMLPFNVKKKSDSDDRSCTTEKTKINPKKSKNSQKLGATSLDTLPSLVKPKHKKLKNHKENKLEKITKSTSTVKLVEKTKRKHSSHHLKKHRSLLSVNNKRVSSDISLDDETSLTVDTQSSFCPEKRIPDTENKKNETFKNLQNYKYENKPSILCEEEEKVELPSVLSSSSSDLIGDTSFMTNTTAQLINNNLLYKEELNNSKLDLLNLNEKHNMLVDKNNKQCASLEQSNYNEIIGRTVSQVKSKLGPNYCHDLIRRRTNEFHNDYFEYLGKEDIEDVSFTEKDEFIEKSDDQLIIVDSSASDVHEENPIMSEDEKRAIFEEMVGPRVNYFKFDSETDEGDESPCGVYLNKLPQAFRIKTNSDIKKFEMENIVRQYKYASLLKIMNKSPKPDLRLKRFRKSERIEKLYFEPLCRRKRLMHKSEPNRYIPGSIKRFSKKGNLVGGKFMKRELGPASVWHGTYGNLRKKVEASKLCQTIDETMFSEHKSKYVTNKASQEDKVFNKLESKIRKKLIQSNKSFFVEDLSDIWDEDLVPKCLKSHGNGSSIKIQNKTVEKTRLPNALETAGKSCPFSPWPCPLGRVCPFPPPLSPVVCKDILKEKVEWDRPIMSSYKPIFTCPEGVPETSNVLNSPIIKTPNLKPDHKLKNTEKIQRKRFDEPKYSKISVGTVTSTECVILPKTISLHEKPEKFTKLDMSSMCKNRDYYNNIVKNTQIKTSSRYYEKLNSHSEQNLLDKLHARDNLISHNRFKNLEKILTANPVKQPESNMIRRNAFSSNAAENKLQNNKYRSNLTIRKDHRQMLGNLFEGIGDKKNELLMNKIEPKSKKTKCISRFENNNRTISSANCIKKIDVGHSKIKPVLEADKKSSTVLEKYFNSTQNLLKHLGNKETPQKWDRCNNYSILPEKYPYGKPKTKEREFNPTNRKRSNIRLDMQNEKKFQIKTETARARSVPKNDLARIPPKNDFPRTAPKNDLTRTAPKNDLERTLPKNDLARTLPKNNFCPITPKSKTQNNEELIRSKQSPLGQHNKYCSKGNYSPINKNSDKYRLDAQPNDGPYFKPIQKRNSSKEMYMFRNWNPVVLSNENERDNFNKQL